MLVVFLLAVAASPGPSRTPGPCARYGLRHPPPHRLLAIPPQPVDTGALNGIVSALASAGPGSGGAIHGGRPFTAAELRRASSHEYAPLDCGDGTLMDDRGERFTPPSL